ncbi:retrovirus-related pol polyprotein from transposon TNT 1-94 [Tanacetum coccineum]|uniref:Retrovirus-related pol polyprotein from transposon TNT 1-94 n=1 Tax=Tanacetum coccineum TaxID=301880 RepID=A0ABQ5AJA3_9ASTR
MSNGSTCTKIFSEMHLISLHLMTTILEHGKAEERGAIESSDATKVTKPKADKVNKPVGDKAPNPTATQPPKPKPTPTQPSKAASEKKQKLDKETPDEPSPSKRLKGGLVGKRRKPKSPLKLVDEPSDEGVPIEDPAHTDEEVDLQRALELSLKEQAEQTQGPARPVVLRDPDSGKYQPLPEVQGKGKEKVVDEQVAHDLVTLQTPTKMSPVDQFIFQRHPPTHTEPTGQAESPSLDVKLPLTDSETESDEEVPMINAGDHDEGQARTNPGEQDEGQARSNPGDAAESQPQPSHGVHAGPNHEHMDFEATDASSQQKPEKMDEEFTTSAYPNVPRIRELNAETEVQLMVSVPIHQDTSSVPPMITLVIDLTTMQSDSPLPTSTTSIITTTTSLSPPPQPSNHLLNHNKFFEEIQILLDKQGTWLYSLENLNIHHKDLPTVDMKEILQQLMFEDNSYKAHEAHNDLYEALQKTPSGSPPSPPPPPPPPAGTSGAPGTLGASGSSQLPPPSPPSSTGTSESDQLQGSKAPSSSKSVASTHQSMTWTTSDTRFKSTGFTAALELSPTNYLMQDDSIPEEHVHLSDDEDSENDHQPKADSRKD